MDSVKIEGDIIAYSFIISRGGTKRTPYIDIKENCSEETWRIAVEARHQEGLSTNSESKKKLYADVDGKKRDLHLAMPPHVRDRNPLETISVEIS